MQDTLVSSRISLAKKEAGVEALSSIGSTMSDLINGAVDYVIANKALPSAEAVPAPTHRAQSFTGFVSASTLSIDWGESVVDYKDVLRTGKVADYEHLA